MTDPKARRARQEAMRQIKRKQEQLLPGGSGGGRWRLDVSVSVLVVQALAMLALGVLVGIGLHTLLYIFEIF